MIENIVGGMAVGLAVWLFTYGLNRAWLVFISLTS